MTALSVAQATAMRQLGNASWIAAAALERGCLACESSHYFRSCLVRMVKHVLAHELCGAVCTRVLRICLKPLLQAEAQLVELNSIQESIAAEFIWYNVPAG